MRRLPISLLAILIAVGVAVLGSSDATAAPPVNCGPGPHWVDSCGGGIPPYPDVYPASILVGIDLDFDPNCLSDLNVPMSGPVTVHRQDASDNSANFPGLPNPPVVDAHIDAIDTEIVSMVLTGGGMTLRAGAATGVGPNGPLLLPSKGLVVEQAADNTKADSFFDVFLELDLGGGLWIYNQQPRRVTAVIGQVPPVGAAYLQPNVCLPLYTSPVAGQGIHVANLAGALPPTPAPPTPTPAPPAPGVGGIVEQPVDGAARQADASGSSGGRTLAIGLAAAAAALALGAGGWYARRRLVRR